MPSRVLSVGHCDYDHGNLRRLVRDNFDADLVSVGDAATALGMLRSESFDLVLVNRVFDATGEAGIEFIRQAREAAPEQTTPLMLVSNYAEWQDQAVSLGAVRGFGKDALRTPSTLAILGRFLPPREKVQPPLQGSYHPSHN